MGYELHIVRRVNWEDDEDSHISLEEWLNYVESDTELELTNGFEMKLPDRTSSFHRIPGFCNWTGHSTKTEADKPWFHYGFGMISAKYPDDDTIRKMLMIAGKLNARVQGDDGEFYDESYFMISE